MVDTDDLARMTHDTHDSPIRFLEPVSEEYHIANRLPSFRHGSLSISSTPATSRKSSLASATLMAPTSCLKERKVYTQTTEGLTREGYVNYIPEKHHDHSRAMGWRHLFKRPVVRQYIHRGKYYVSFLLPLHSRKPKIGSRETGTCENLADLNCSST